ncbi:unnamed protein product [Mytilus edulis]|uniref:WSC domain-containing protein n=1 Tax=Mytilus edulis TaxID=6550 RepID=A0A8S3RBC7_MYTED|nr:unnamed protein product [Mytilus edulis]
MFAWILFFIHFHYATCIYQVAQEGKSWEDSQRYCNMNNGQLAHVYSMNLIPDSWKSRNGFWVGGLLNDKGFNWITKIKGKDAEIPLAPLIFHRRCYRPSFILGGHAIQNLSAEKCFKQCKWKGVIGLKSFYCLCEENLRNFSRTVDDHCDVKCDGNPSELCGGPKGVSMYNLNNKAVLWGANEPNEKYECVYIRKQQGQNDLLWLTSSCNMRMRYICHFEDHEACGVKKHCLRSSIQPDTWQASIEGCRLLNGTTAIVDVNMMYDNEDISLLPPGEYWVGLKRSRRWEWINGLPISSSLFRNRKTFADNDKCVALSNIDGSLGLVPSSCLEKKPFICQYDIRGNEAHKFQHSDSIQSYEDTTRTFLKSQKMTPYMDAEILIRKSRNASNSSDPNTLESTEDYQTFLYKSVMYLAIGVAAGMGFVFSLCIIIYVGKRCRSRTTEFKTVRYPKGMENPILRYANDTNGNHATPSEPEVLYEIPCDAQESPFRTTQRILQQNYVISRDGVPTNSWRRKNNGSQQRQRQPEVRNIHPYSERSYGDTSYIIHNVRAQCHPSDKPQGQPIDITYTGSLDTRLRKPSHNQQNSDVRLSDTYSLPDQGRKLSEPILHVDTSDLYACVEKALQDSEDDYYDNTDQKIRVTVC